MNPYANPPKMDTFAKFCVFRKIAFEMLVIIISPVYYYICARADVQSLFGARGMKKLPAFFLITEKKSVFTKGVSSISDALYKSNGESISPRFSKEKSSFFSSQTKRAFGFSSVVRVC
jgi:hypothetical protein